MLIATTLLSLLVGASLGLLGGGGSILMVPILRYVAKMEAHEAIALSLLVVGTTSIAAAIPHARRGHVQVRTAVMFGAAGMAGAYLAGRVSKFIPSALLLLGFALMMLVTAGAMLREGRSPRKDRRKPGDRLPILHIVAEGLVVGAVTGLVGAGGGFLVVPALSLLGGLSMATAVGTSLVVIAMNSFAGFAGYVGHVPIEPAWAVSVTLAAVAGSVAGTRLSTRLSAEALRSAFGWFVLAMAFFVMAQELPALLGAAPSLPLALLATALGPLAIYGAIAWRRHRRHPELPPADRSKPNPPRQRLA